MLTYILTVRPCFFSVSVCYCFSYILLSSRFKLNDVLALFRWGYPIKNETHRRPLVILSLTCLAVLMLKWMLVSFAFLFVLDRSVFV